MMTNKTKEFFDDFGSAAKRANELNKFSDVKYKVLSKDGTYIVQIPETEKISLVEKIISEAFPSFPDKFKDDFKSKHSYDEINLQLFLKKYCPKAVYETEADEEALDVLYNTFPPNDFGNFEHNPYGKVFKKNGKVRTLNINNIVFCQEFISLQGSDKIAPVNVVMFKGRYVLIDGNHRICMALYNKKKTIDAYVINLDKNLNEDVKTLDYLKTKDAVKDSDKLRVYHGFNNQGIALKAVKYGLSGQERANRIYSYETVNNPKGLFVSVSFDVVKRNFAHGGIIIEFDTLASNLEAPVWAGQDNFFVPGQYTKGFNRDTIDAERKAEQKRKGDMYREADPEGIEGDRYAMGQRVSKSDRPELAQSLFDNSEKQALFVGNLDPNNIKFVWFHHELFYNRRTTGDFKRMTRQEFLKMMADEIKKRREDGYDNPLRKAEYKLFKPNEDFTIEKLTAILNKKQYDVEDFLKYYGRDPHHLEQDLYPKQIAQLKKYLDDNNIEDLS